MPNKLAVVSPKGSILTLTYAIVNNNNKVISPALFCINNAWMRLCSKSYFDLFLHCGWDISLTLSTASAVTRSSRLMCEIRTYTLGRHTTSEATWPFLQTVTLSHQGCWHAAEFYNTLLCFMFVFGTPFPTFGTPNQSVRQCGSPPQYHQALRPT